VEIQGLSFSLRGIPILDGISADFPTAQISAIIGSNGAGKTTLLRCLSGEFAADSGGVGVGGRDVDPRSDEWKRAVGVVPDADQLFDELTVQEQLSLAASVFGITGDEQRTRVESLLALSDLTDRKDSAAAELSAGMRKRLAVALALIHAPRILLFDEPLNTMDFASSETFFGLLRYLRSIDRTILITGHSLQSLVRVADRFVEIEAGRVINSVQMPEGARTAEAITPLLRSRAGGGRSVEAAAREIDLAWMSP